ncbi:MAG: hypothetical protein HY866_18825 [Chloroflexi bacterium]|nr:hypothetical protein [Chloroflexota bacterium]
MTQVRIIEYGSLPPSDLKPHPLNARLHPKQQQEALHALLDEVGWVRRVIVNRRTGYMLNGHLRREEALAASAEQVPVAYVDLDEAEEALILTFFDEIAGMAVSDRDRLVSIVAAAQTESKPLALLLSRMALEAGIGLNFEVTPDGDENNETPQADVGARIGELNIKIPREQFLRWRDGIYQTVGMEEKVIVQEIRRRLGL